MNGHSPGLHLPMQAAPVTRNRSAAALSGQGGVEASSLFGFIQDLVTGDWEHMLSSAVEDIGEWVTGS